MRIDVVFETKRSMYDTKWLSLKGKERLSGINKNQHQQITIRDSLLSFLIMIKYDNESNSKLLDSLESKK